MRLDPAMKTLLIHCRLRVASTFSLLWILRTFSTKLVGLHKVTLLRRKFVTPSTDLFGLERTFLASVKMNSFDTAGVISSKKSNIKHAICSHLNAHQILRSWMTVFLHIRC